MNKGLLTDKAARLRDKAARAAYCAAVALATGYPADAALWAARADRLDSMAADYSVAASKSN